TGLVMGPNKYDPSSQIQQNCPVCNSKTGLLGAVKSDILGEDVPKGYLRCASCKAAGRNYRYNQIDGGRQITNPGLQKGSDQSVQRKLIKCGKCGGEGRIFCGHCTMGRTQLGEICRVCMGGYVKCPECPGTGWVAPQRLSRECDSRYSRLLYLP